CHVDAAPLDHADAAGTLSPTRPLRGAHRQRARGRSATTVPAPDRLSGQRETPDLPTPGTAGAGRTAGRPGHRRPAHLRASHGGSVTSAWSTGLPARRLAPHDAL